jgi:hypothetical protein
VSRDFSGGQRRRRKPPDRTQQVGGNQGLGSGARRRRAHLAGLGLREEPDAGATGWRQRHANGKPAYVYYISPTQISVLTPPDAMSGAVQVLVTNSGATSASFTAQAHATSPSFFVFNGGPLETY